MSRVPALPDLRDGRPADFQGRFARKRRSRGIIGRTAAPRRAYTRRIGTALTMAALTAFAMPGTWERFRIANAATQHHTPDPMPFEQAGASFPGSAFYYLEADKAAQGEGLTGTIVGHAIGQSPTAQALHVLDLPFTSSPTDRARALQCLTSAIYYEAASEPDAGQRAVAQVVLNRLAHPSYPDTVCGVVYQGSELGTGCQFSFTCDGSLSRRPATYFWNRAEAVARGALSGEVYAPAGLATHYHTLQVAPYWTSSLQPLTTIGAHRFYSFKGAAGRAATFRYLYAGMEPANEPHRPAPTALTLASDAQNDPAAIQQAFEDIARALAAQPAVGTPGSATVSATTSPSAPAADGLPAGARVRPEYRNSGRWIERGRSTTEAPDTP
ncbi:cell wall hydrolase [Novosphingobium mangrovi (ex Hu et al. 2023)]|uniref:Cell wall hydrolase n=1 Tax=Novosphingobium mangrovi (ex Hu et al. 2023) TaxID=2930094 RepID=A0ABT0A845_9SPHN|nr:cell wall hydrolase [Novosphingobium mangrovi (ex Hu et al. 2023)]MCJ1959370.1 cell wall hydrolase [Novosphingobium mangrovi (ex Hu et al. 2023)]